MVRKRVVTRSDDVDSDQNYEGSQIRDELQRDDIDAAYESAVTALNQLQAALSHLNAKRTYDVNQDVDLERTRAFNPGGSHLNDLNNQTVRHTEELHAQKMRHAEEQFAIRQQAIESAVTTVDMVAKQAVRHGDLAIDHQWNPVQQGAGDALTARAVSIDDASLKAIGAVVAVALADTAVKK